VGAGGGYNRLQSRGNLELRQPHLPWAFLQSLIARSRAILCKLLVAYVFNNIVNIRVYLLDNSLITSFIFCLQFVTPDTENVLVMRSVKNGVNCYLTLYMSSSISWNVAYRYMKLYVSYSPFVPNVLSGCMFCMIRNSLIMHLKGSHLYERSLWKLFCFETISMRDPGYITILTILNNSVHLFEHSFYDICNMSLNKTLNWSLWVK
jgi:hypothetical protein